jgi:hypothetical protein
MPDSPPKFLFYDKGLHVASIAHFVDVVHRIHVWVGNGSHANYEKPDSRLPFVSWVFATKFLTVGACGIPRIVLWMCEP